MKRRDFLKTATISIASISALPCISLLNSSLPGSTAMAENYCPSVEDVLAYFDNNVSGERKVWEDHYGKETAEDILSKAREEIILLAPAMPCIPDEHNSLKGAYVELAKYLVQKEYTKKVEDIASIQNEALAYLAFNIPWIYRFMNSFAWFTKSNIEAVKENCLQSQKREYTNNWVSVFVEGDGKTFAYGYDIYECPAVNCFPRHNGEEFTKYVCSCDDILSDAFGHGLKRISTIARGADICDFRYTWQFPRLLPRSNYLPE